MQKRKEVLPKRGSGAIWGVMPSLSGFVRGSNRQMGEIQSRRWRHHFAEFKTSQCPKRVGGSVTVCHINLCGISSEPIRCQIVRTFWRDNIWKIFASLSGKMITTGLASEVGTPFWWTARKVAPHTSKICRLPVLGSWNRWSPSISYQEYFRFSREG